MAQKSNLTIEVLSIIGGILTAIFFLGFLALASILRSEISCLITGSILIITTLIINRRLTKPFLDAMNITCYIAGCILAGFGMSSNIDVLFIVLIGISIVTMLLSKGFILTPFGGFILYSLIRRNNKFTLSAESSECGYCTYHGCFFICQSIGDENTQPYKWGSF